MARILAKIIGWFFISMGILFFVKPALLKVRLQKKSIKRIRKYLCFIAVFMGIILIKLSWGREGALPMVIMVLGILAIVKGFIFVKGEVSKKIIEWFSAWPLSFFRFVALLYVGIGIVVLLGTAK